MSYRSQILCGAAAVSLLAGGISTGVSAAERQSMEVRKGAKDASVLRVLSGFPRVVVSRHGNIVGLEGPRGYEHLASGAIGEGYVLCYGGSQAFDVGESEAGFTTGTASCTSTSCTVTRNTIDNRLELKQVISKSSAERSATIAMTVRNLTGSSISGVVLRRQADLDVDTGGTLGTASFQNWFGSTERESAFAWNPPGASPREEHAIVLTFGGGTPATFAKVTSDILDTSCNPSNIAADGPVQGDHGVTLQFNLGTLVGSGSRSMKVKYQRN